MRDLISDSKNESKKLGARVTFWIVSILLVLPLYSFSEEIPGYSASESGSVLKVRTPQGAVVFFSEKSLEKSESYQIEIPLSEIDKSLPVAAGGGGGANAPSDTPDLRRYKTVDELLVSANILYNQGKSQIALHFVEEIISRSPNHFRGLVMRGSLYRVLGFKDLALESYKKAYRVNPKDEEIKNVLRSFQ